MSFRFFLFLLSFFLITPLLALSHAQTPPKSEFSKAQVIDITKEQKEQQNIIQSVRLQILDGQEKGEIITTTYSLSQKNADQKLQKGTEVVLEKSQVQNKAEYRVIDTYRLPQLTAITIAFFIFVILVAGKKGAGSIAGMAISLAVILYFIVPQILNGQDPLLISIIGSVIILSVTLLLAHGIRQQTFIALGATALTLILTGILAVFFVSLTKLTGLGSEDAYTIQMTNAALNVKGLLLGGIIIGALGVLDDITTSQTAVVFELAKANEKLKVQELFQRGFNVGREHIVSLVNTLVLAYAGTSLAIFMLFSLNPLQRPYWVILNNEMIVEEIVRTLAGSIGLILAVPITTLLAAFFSRYSLKIK
jgi:uncharacterized membrane protein